MRIFFILMTVFSSSCFAHCQMPCGIYNDQMVYDEINQYYLTMYKAVKVLEHSHFETLEDKNNFIRWVMTKEELSDRMAHLITSYFLQQKIAPMEENTDCLKCLHKLLFLLVAIKQNVDIKIVKEFGKEWDHFKELFHADLPCRATSTTGEGEASPTQISEQHKGA